jgi:stage V sporulation protein SpoVS
MHFKLAISSAAAPERVASALAASLRCRPVPVPPELKRSGIKGVRVSVREMRFSVVPDTNME